LKEVARMSRIERFTLRVTASEQTMIGELARRLQRNQSDAVRFLIREALKGLTFTEDTTDDDVSSEQTVLIAE
jgi:hypothetical protein